MSNPKLWRHSRWRLFWHFLTFWVKFIESDMKNLFFRGILMREIRFFGQFWHILSKFDDIWYFIFECFFVKIRKVDFLINKPINLIISESDIIPRTLKNLNNQKKTISNLMHGHQRNFCVNLGLFTKAADSAYLSRIFSCPFDKIMSFVRQNYWQIFKTFQLLKLNFWDVWKSKT